MARPTKEGLDYFPHTCNSTNDVRLEYLEAKHGIVAYAVYFKLLERIYDKGYFIEWNEREALMFCKRANIEVETLNEILATALDEGLFSKELYSQYKILTSKGIQERFFEAVGRRKNLEIIRQYMQIDTNNLSAGINVTITEVNVAITPVNDELSTQSKVKESKVKYISQESEKNTVGCPFDSTDDDMPLSEPPPQNHQVIEIYNELLPQRKWTKPNQRKLEEAYIYWREHYPSDKGKTPEVFIEFIKWVVKNRIQDNERLLTDSGDGHSVLMTPEKLLTQTDKGYWWQRIHDGEYAKPKKKKQIQRMPGC